MTLPRALLLLAAAFVLMAYAVEGLRDHHAEPAPVTVEDHPVTPYGGEP